TICHLPPTGRKSRRSDFSFCKYRKKRKPPIILASLGCFFAHLSYSLRTARFASSFFMLVMPFFSCSACLSRVTANWMLIERSADLVCAHCMQRLKVSNKKVGKGTGLCRGTHLRSPN